MPEFDPTEFHPGLRLGNRPEDFFLGKNSPIPFEARNTTGEWGQFRSVPEDQFNLKGDWWNCTNQSGENQFEAQANWALKNNLWPAEALKFFSEGYIVDGKFKISTRFNSKMSGTKPGVGNYLYLAQESIRNDGVVPESVWPTEPNMTVEEYYAEPFDHVKDLAKRSKQYFDWLYEFLTDVSDKNLTKQLQHCPIQLGVGTCPGWGENAPVPVCQMWANHAILLEAKQFSPRYSIILDHYQPYIKKLAPGYIIASAVKGILYPKGGDQPKTDIVSPLIKDIVYGNSGEEVSHLKRALAKIGWLPDYRYNPGTLDIYDAELAQAVFKFQLANVSRVFLEMILSLKGKRVGPRTRAAINEAIKYR